MLNNLKWKNGNGGISGSWAAPLPNGFAQLFREMCQLYYYSAAKPPNVWLQKITKSMEQLLVEYFKINKLAEGLWTADPFEVPKTEPVPMSKDKITIMFTGGKDSLHVLLHLLDKGTKPENIQCVYIPNINKSESVYERITVEKICSKLGVDFNIVAASNSVKLNREGHNIGLRDQLLVVLALPYIVKFGSKRIIFGLHDAFWNVSGPLFTSHSTAFRLLDSRVKEMGIEIEVEPHPVKGITEVEITTQLLQKWPDYFWMTNSCYRQLNFREKQHKCCQERHPDFKIYNGCGNCLKCLRINGILALFESSGNFAARWNMAKEVNNTFIKKYPDDHTLLEIVGLLRDNILETKHSDVSTKAPLPAHT